MRTRTIVGSSTVLGVAIAAVLVARPSRSIPRGPELLVPEHIPAQVRQVIASKMRRHGEQLPDLVSKAVMLDYAGAAKAAGEIYDEPGLARPIEGDELNGLLPERFFVLEDELRKDARRIVEASARHDSRALAETLGDLTRACVTCHDIYLRSGTP